MNTDESRTSFYNDKILEANSEEQMEMYTLKKAADTNIKSSVQSLTGLYNTRAFFYYGQEVIKRNSNLKYAVIRIDIYRFKTINEICGWDEGDKLLIYIADLLRGIENSVTVVAHCRADVFAICLPYKEVDDIINIVTELKQNITKIPINCKIHPSFGICLDKPGVYIAQRFDYANMALDKVKGKLFNFYAFYKDEMRQQLLEEKKIEDEISDALDKNEIEVYIQPKVCMESRKIIGGEALVRWIHPQKGIISPATFIPVIEKSGYIINLDVYVWEQVIKTISEWKINNIKYVPISVNVSRLHIYQKDFISILVGLINKYNISPSDIKLEITETAFINENSQLLSCIESLQKFGFLFSMDDFGSDYSSLNMLKDDPVNEVKIDRSFVADMCNSFKSRIVIKNIINMLNELGIDNIVEGVENNEQEKILLDYGCTEAQGFLYYKPMPIKDFEKLLLNS